MVRRNISFTEENEWRIQHQRDNHSRPIRDVLAGEFLDDVMFANPTPILSATKMRMEQDGREVQHTGVG